jgi:hypothetical protein
MKSSLTQIAFCHRPQDSATGVFTKTTGELNLDEIAQQIDVWNCWIYDKFLYI